MGRSRRRGRGTRMEVNMRCHNGHQFPQEVPAFYKRTKEGNTLGPMSDRTGEETCPECGSQRLEIVSGPPN